MFSEGGSDGGGDCNGDSDVPMNMGDELVGYKSGPSLMRGAVAIRYERLSADEAAASGLDLSEETHACFSRLDGTAHHYQLRFWPRGVDLVELTLLGDNIGAHDELVAAVAWFKTTMNGDVGGFHDELATADPSETLEVADINADQAVCAIVDGTSSRLLITQGLRTIFAVPLSSPFNDAARFYFELTADSFELVNEEEVSKVWLLLRMRALALTGRAIAAAGAHSSSFAWAAAAAPMWLVVAVSALITDVSCLRG